MKQQLELIPLLEMFGLDMTKKTQLLIHSDIIKTDCTPNKETSIEYLYNSGQIDLIEEYQEEQGVTSKGKSRAIEGNEVIISTIKLKSGFLKFIGVYNVIKNRGKIKPSRSKRYKDIMTAPIEDSELFYFELKKDERFKELEGRIIIGGEFGRNFMRKHDTLIETPYVISEILPSGYIKAFPGYNNVILSFGELKNLLANKNTNQEWYKMLSCVSGIYLITIKDQNNPSEFKPYIGSARGKDGLWGRWKDYTKQADGGNVGIKEYLIEQGITEANNINNFDDDIKFSIMEVLYDKTDSKYLFDREKLWKNKLGSKITGLNRN